MSTRTFLISLIIAVGMTSILFGNLTPQIHTAGQQQTRTLKTREWEKEPIKIVAVTNKSGRAIPVGKGHLADDDWLRGLTISIKNMSKKNILFVELELHFLRPEGSSDETVTAFPIVFGTPPGLIAQTPSPVMLPPNENWHVSLADQEYARIGELLAGTDYPKSIKEVEIITREVVFADKTKWSEGEMRDPAKEAERGQQMQASKKEDKWAFQPVGFEGLFSFSFLGGATSANSAEPAQSGQCGNASDDTSLQCFPYVISSRAVPERLSQFCSVADTRGDWYQ